MVASALSPDAMPLLRPLSPHPAPAQRGISLVELLIALCVLGVTLALAAPAASGVIAHVRMETSMHLLHSQLSIARNTAITRGIPIRVCPSDDGLRCSQDSNWNRRWLMFQSPRQERHPGSPSAILQVTDPPHLPVTAAIRSSSARRHVRFQPDGRSGGSNLSICFYDQDRPRGRIVVNNPGRVRAERTSSALHCP